MDYQLFSTAAGRDIRWAQFLASSLGALYQAIPFDQLVATFPRMSGLGRPPHLDVRGGIALQVLKAYLDLSDEKLLDRLNTDWALQYFCGISLRPAEMIRDKDLVSRWRRYLARHIDYEIFQQQLALHWKPVMKNTQVVLMDATCYESHLRHPTDVKLLWECCEWLWAFIDQTCASLRVHKVRRKQDKLYGAYLSYQKRRRKTHRQEHGIRRRLLRFLHKGLKSWDQVVFEHHPLLRQRDFDRLQTIRNVYQQQQQRYDDPQAPIKNRIVSLAKPYIRPIVRGKETKSSEFGAKVHVWQSDGISFVEHLDFNAFNESTRLPETLRKHAHLFGSVHQLGADQIYATNANRRLCTFLQIATSFVRKGPKPNQPTPRDQMRSILSKARASVMEGAFGNDKQHYGLHKILARTQATETLWIYFGIWTASAVRVGKRMALEKSTKKAA